MITMPNPCFGVNAIVAFYVRVPQLYPRVQTEIFELHSNRTCEKPGIVCLEAMQWLTRQTVARK